MSWTEDLSERARSQAKREPQGSRLSASSLWLRYIKEIRSAPPLWRMNGFGVGLYGHMDQRYVRRGTIKLYFLTALWLPLIPLHGYVVERVNDEYRFHGSVSLFGLIRLLRWRFISLYFSAILDGAALLVLFGTLIFAVVGGLGWLRNQL